MKKILFAAMVVFLAFAASAQDILIMQNGEELETKIIEVNDTHVKYKLYNDLEGNIYIVNRKDAFKIKYASGSVSLLNEHKAVEETEIIPASTRRVGLAIRPELGGVLVTDDRLSNAMHSFDIGVNIVYQFTRKFSLGGGVSYYGVKNCGSFLPVYVNIRGYFRDRMYSPYYDLRVGYSIPTSEHRTDINNGMPTYGVAKIKGAYLRVGFGMDVKNFILGINFGLCVLKESRYCDQGNGYVKTNDYEINEVFFGLNIGYNIQCSKKK